MKKFLAIVLAAVLCLSCAALAEEATKTTLLTLYLESVTMEGTEYPAAAMGMTSVMECYDDGTMALSAMGDTQTGTWTEAENDLVVTFGADEESMTTLQMTVNPEDPTHVTAVDPTGADTNIYVFTTEEVAAIQLPAVVAATDIAEFNGAYAVKYVDAMGVTVDAEMLASTGELDFLLGENATLEVAIDNGKVSVFGQDAIEMVLNEDGTLGVQKEIAEAAGDLGLDLDLNTAIVVMKTETGVAVSMLSGMMVFYCE